MPRRDRRRSHPPGVIAAARRVDCAPSSTAPPPDRGSDSQAKGSLKSDWNPEQNHAQEARRQQAVAERERRKSPEARSADRESEIGDGSLRCPRRRHCQPSAEIASGRTGDQSRKPRGGWPRTRTAAGIRGGASAAQ
ncbi:hypothetical protein ebA5106 [Aromatoleum aromaticum EbN1]|uniref:Uncharacterized protein n=1 Tax=Aromatoleum aromaticum (strain DSM 19018 / LMG 30748 / EbN1) TaxID=76114 RepID=Q5P0Z1_AROAE|nr:hypothetical protein ebA5106 [Aromatoleum aromaticum EbN1]